MSTPGTRANQCRKPAGWFGRFVLRNMNSRHSKVTDWGLAHLTIGSAILDVGCGGGRTIGKLAALAPEARVYGIDHSAESVAVATRVNARAVEAGRVEVLQGSVSQLPFPGETFDLVTAVETHFFWPDLPNDVREVLRCLKPGGMFVLIAEVYRGASSATAKLVEKYAQKTGMTLLTVDGHRDLFENAGFSEIQVYEESRKGWICCTGRKGV
ncbi:MAG TPA: class I SAM-dependent methyltransferase [Acidobacteriaceae bacterium]